MLVVRVENRGDGKGIFRTNAYFSLYDEVPELWKRHMDFPTPDVEYLDVDLGGKEWFCSFPTMDVFNKWVTKEEVKTLITLNFDVLLLEVDEVQVGELQVVFTKESIKSSKIINSLFE